MAAVATASNALAGPRSGSLRQRRDALPPPSLPAVRVLTAARTQRLRAEALATISPISTSSAAASNLFSQPPASPAAVFDFKKEVEEEERKDSVTAERIDQWIRDSIGEIVRNIGEAPLLVQIFSRGSSTPRLESSRASPEAWPHVKRQWGESSRVPDGVILVEELKDNAGEDDFDKRAAEEEGCSKTWGLVVQGRGMDCAAPCYILNTCRVRSSAGFCTHYCLVRAKCFGETLEKQLGKAWLQGR